MKFGLEIDLLSLLRFQSFLLVLFIYDTSASRILLLGSSIKISGNFMEVLGVGEELARRSHEVYISIAIRTTGDNEAKRFMIVQNITQLSYKLKKDYSFADDIDKIMTEDLFKTNIKLSIFPSGLFDFANLVTNECEEALADDEFILKLKNLKFDIVVLNRFTPSPCFYLIPYFLKVPCVSIGTAFEFWLGCSPTLPSFAHNVLFNYGDNMNFWQRLTNFLLITGISVAMKLGASTRTHDHLLKTYAPGKNSFKEIADESLLFFVTREHVVQWPLPSMPNVITVPSAGCIPPNDLPDDLNKIITLSKHGIIIVSFGSLSEYLPKEVIGKLAAAFKEVKQDVIWKFPFKGANPSDFSLSKNVHVVKWLPQNDLLGHNNTKLFITHCGNNGQYESICQGVPMIAFPMFGDQHHNAFRIEHKNFGVALNIVKFNIQEWLNAINNVIENTTFSTNVKIASAVLKDAPMTSRATIAYWIEHVIKFGNYHLRSHAIDLAWYEYFMIDVLLAVSIVFIITLFVIVKLITYCCRFMCKQKQCEKKKKAE